MPTHDPSPQQSIHGEDERERALWQELSQVRDPEILRPITELGMVREARVDHEGRATIALSLTIAGCPAARHIEAEIVAAALRVPGVSDAQVAVSVMSAEDRRAFIKRVRGGRGNAPGQFTPESLTRVFAVTSGKGGVGKSSITVNLAVALAARGLSVGIIDADVFGFSVPGLLGLVHEGRVTPPTRVDEMILPPVAHGVKVISIGMFLGDADARETAVSWRGPMLHRTIEQFLQDVWFGDLDVLLLDLPPGTGDIAISVGQLLPQAEVLVVTTPQPAAADVAVRSGVVARQTGQRVIGVIENMAGFTGDDGTRIELFGSGGGAETAERLSAGAQPVPLLGSVPLSQTFRQCGDDGKPAVLACPNDAAARELQRIAEQLLRRAETLAGARLPLALAPDG